MSLALKERVDFIEERTDSLEDLIKKFITSTNIAHLNQARNISNMGQNIAEQGQNIDRLEKSVEQLSVEMKEFKVEMKEFKDEMKEFKVEMKEFKKEAERDRKRMNKQWGELANKMGTLVEDIVAPNIPGVLKEYFNVQKLQFFALRSIKEGKGGAVTREFDIIAVSEEYFVVNETKSTPRPEYARDFMEVLKQIYDYFPEYESKKLIPIFSSLSIPPNIETYLSKHGIYAMGMKGDTMAIVNFEKVTR
ncbi:hypothetical protein QUF76_17070 [Desulfobacterales bacterium HSG16]|nr:hypothetical protein [Desulfobacterales bacterium HSG16]